MAPASYAKKLKEQFFIVEVSSLARIRSIN